MTTERLLELVERFDRTHRLDLKAGRASKEARTLFAEIADLLWLQEQGELSDVDFMERVNALVLPDEPPPRSPS